MGGKLYIFELLGTEHKVCSTSNCKPLNTLKNKLYANFIDGFQGDNNKLWERYTFFWLKYTDFILRHSNRQNNIYCPRNAR